MTPSDLLSGADPQLKYLLLRSEAVPGCKPAVRSTSPLVGQRGAVATEHRPRPPAEEPHGIPFASTKGEPVVSGRVAKLVWVNRFNTARPTPSFEQLRHTRGREDAFA